MPYINEDLLSRICWVEWMIESQINEYGLDYYEKLFQEKEEKAKENGMTYEEYILYEEGIILIDKQGTIKKDENFVKRCFILNERFVVTISITPEEAEECDLYSIPFHITYYKLFELTFDFNYQQKIYNYHSSLSEDHPFSSKWYTITETTKQTKL